MAHKKTARRGKPARARKKQPLARPSVDPKCNLPNICRYIEELAVWLQHLDADYTALRIAVCNVEKQAFAGSGVDAAPPRFCSGVGNEPPPFPFG